MDRSTRADRSRGVRREGCDAADRGRTGASWGGTSSRPRRPFSNGERRSGRSGEDWRAARRRTREPCGKMCEPRAGTSGEKRRGVSERARRDVSGDQNRTARRRTPFLRRACYHTMMSYTTTETKTRDRDVTGSNPPISLEPRAKRQHPRRRLPRRSRRRPDRRPRHANPRVPVFRGARRSATKPIQNPRNIAAR